MNEVIQDVQHLFKKGQSISYNHSGGNTVYLDPSMMKHIVTNLLSNAIKFSNEGGEVEFITDVRDDEFMISIKDQGIGIPPEDQASLFKRFFRSSNVTNIQGTGLGLHIVSKYAELMNGKIECKSELGKGTQFIITFNDKKASNEINIDY